MRVCVSIPFNMTFFHPLIGDVIRKCQHLRFDSRNLPEWVTVILIDCLMSSLKTFNLIIYCKMERYRFSLFIEKLNYHSFRLLIENFNCIDYEYIIGIWWTEIYIFCHLLQRWNAYIEFICCEFEIM